MFQFLLDILLMNYTGLLKSASSMRKTMYRRAYMLASSAKEADEKLQPRLTSDSKSKLPWKEVCFE